MWQYIRKASKEHVILFSLGITMITLIISSLFRWDNNPITGWDKLSGDVLITLFCLMMILGSLPPLVIAVIMINKKIAKE